MYNVEEKIKLAEETFNQKKPTIFTRVYPFTTENIAGYLSLFDLKDKSLFTVGSSCDQALNAILQGAKEITIFDICNFVYEYYYLKTAAIKTLTLDEFMQFFCYKNSPYPFFNNKYAFDVKAFAKISEVLKEMNEEVLYFWTQVFNKYNGVVVRTELFSADEYRSKLVRMMDLYLKSEQHYQELADKIDNAKVNIIQGDIFKDDITGNYDNIFLSNLSTYHKFAEINDLFNKLLNNLNEDGRILIAYLYDTHLYSDYMEGEPEIYNIPNTLRLLPKDIDFDTFTSARGYLFTDYGIKDSVITYRKVRK